MKRICCLWWTVASLCAFAQNPAAFHRIQPTNLPPIVQLALNAQGKLKYSGRGLVTVHRPDADETLEDLVWQQGLSSRIEYPQGSTRYGEVIVESPSLGRLHYRPHPNEIEVGSYRRGGIRLGLAIPWRHQETTFNVGGLQAIAGQRAQYVEMLTGGKIVQRLWISPESGLVLKKTVLDPHSGRLIFSSEFEQITMNPVISPDMFKLNIPGARIVTQRDLVARLEQSHGFTETILPASPRFTLDGGNVFRPNGSTQTLEQRYSGPGGRFNLFQVKGPVDPRMLNHWAHGLKTLSWSRNGETLAIVGNIDDATLHDVARQLGAPNQP